MLPTLREIVNFYSNREKQALALSAFLRVLLVLLDLAGMALVGASVAILTGTNLNPGSPTGLLVSVIVGIGISNAYAGIAIVSVLFFVLKAVLSMALNRSLTSFVSRVESTKASEIFSRLINSDVARREQWSDSEIHHGLLASIQVMVSGSITSISVIFGEIALIVGVSIFLIATNPLMFTIMAIYFTIIGLVMNHVLGQLATSVGKENERAFNESAHMVSDTLSVFREIQLTGAGPRFARKFSEARGQLAVAGSKMALISVTPRYITEVALMFGLGLLIIQRTLPNASVLAPAVIAIFVTGAFRLVASMLPLQGAIVSLRHLEGTSAVARKMAAEFTEGPTSLHSTMHSSNRTALAVKISDVTYSYPGEKTPALDSISLEIQPRSFVALVGKSGAGKSTLADLLLGFRIPGSGTVSIGGYPARDFIREFPGRVAYVPQFPGLFRGTLQENITLGVTFGEDTEERLRRAILMASLVEFVEELPDGLETRLVEQGRTLSGGQAQRISLARALYTNPEILVLDEPTSALDEETERQIATTLNALKGTLTIIVIAHRRASIEMADRIVRLSRGSLV
jgi:ABC-type multidrug transport system fused ATPase/permease subunit